MISQISDCCFMVDGFIFSSVDEYYQTDEDGGQELVVRPVWVVEPNCSDIERKAMDFLNGSDEDEDECPF